MKILESEIFKNGSIKRHKIPTVLDTIIEMSTRTTRVNRSMHKPTFGEGSEDGFP